ncbi:hypothetical protein CSKR_112164 [Clonorchis sinensis]|uniref:Uncharacterized protein n=1 Tax=Clonorchis sinensis TaxID=79923 RepID=A0A419Q965_CLOSI|nr:hypothetical protein CSKR_112164 [Clonorchis sinensis]
MRTIALNTGRTTETLEHAIQKIASPSTNGGCQIITCQNKASPLHVPKPPPSTFGGLKHRRAIATIRNLTVCKEILLRKAALSATKRTPSVVGETTPKSGWRSKDRDVRFCALCDLPAGSSYRLFAANQHHIMPIVMMVILACCGLTCFKLAPKISLLGVNSSVNTTHQDGLMLPGRYPKVISLSRDVMFATINRLAMTRSGSMLTAHLDNLKERLKANPPKHPANRETWLPHDLPDAGVLARDYPIFQGQVDRLDDANFAASPDLMFWFLIFHSLHFSRHVSSRKPLVLPSLVLFLPATFKS